MERLAGFYEAFTRKTFLVGEGDEARYLKLVLNTLVGGTQHCLPKRSRWGARAVSAPP
jgi:hypothetical protein